MEIRSKGRQRCVGKMSWWVLVGMAGRFLSVVLEMAQTVPEGGKGWLEGMDSGYFTY